MTQFFKKNLTQTATYWAKSGVDGYGKNTFAAPVQMPCRWEERADLFRDFAGREVVSAAVVYTADAVETEGYLFLGTSAGAYPYDVAGAFEVRGLTRSQALTSGSVLFKSWL